jgi:hypothetical protein
VESGPRPSDEDQPQESEDPPPPRACVITAPVTGAVAPGCGGGWGPGRWAPPSRTPRRTPSCSRPPPHPACRRKENPSQEWNVNKRSCLSFSSILIRSNSEGFLTLLTSVFSRMPGAVSMAVIPSRRNAGPARQGKAWLKRKNEGKEDARSPCAYLPGKTRRRRAASRQGGGRRRAPQRRPHEPSSKPLP